MRAVLRWTWRTLPCIPTVHLRTCPSHIPTLPPLLPPRASNHLRFSTLHLAVTPDDPLPLIPGPPPSTSSSHSSVPSSPTSPLNSDPFHLPYHERSSSPSSFAFHATAQGFVRSGDLTALTALLASLCVPSLRKSQRALHLVQRLLREESKAPASAFSLSSTRLILEAAKVAGVPSAKDELCQRLHLLAIIRQAKATNSTAEVLGDCQAALAAISSPPPLFSTSICNLLLYAALLSCNAAFVPALFAQMKAVVPPLLPTSLTLSLAVQCMLASNPRALESALRVYSEVREWARKGVTASSDVCLQLMRSCLASVSDRRYEGNCVAFVPLLYADLIEAGRSVESSHLLALLAAFEEMGLEGEAVKELDRMEERRIPHSDEVDVLALHLFVKLESDRRLFALIAAMRRRHRSTAASISSSSASHDAAAPRPPPCTPSLVQRYRKALLRAGKRGRSAQLLPLLSLLFAIPTWSRAVLTADFNADLMRVWSSQRSVAELRQSIYDWRTEREQRTAERAEVDAWTAWIAAAGLPPSPPVYRSARSDAGRPDLSDLDAGVRERLYVQLEALLASDGPLQVPGSFDPTPFVRSPELPWVFRPWVKSDRRTRQRPSTRPSPSPPPWHSPATQYEKLYRKELAAAIERLLQQEAAVKKARTEDAHEDNENSRAL